MVAAPVMESHHRYLSPSRRKLLRELREPASVGGLPDGTDSPAGPQLLHRCGKSPTGPATLAAYLVQGGSQPHLPILPPGGIQGRYGAANRPGFESAGHDPLVG